MKRIVLVMSIAILAAHAQAASQSQVAFAQHLIKTEPKIKDATWSTSTRLYVGVLDDGTKRDGYAQYVCQLAAPQGATMVKVIDIAKVKRTGKFEELGKAYCK